MVLTLALVLLIFGFGLSVVKSSLAGGVAGVVPAGFYMLCILLRRDTTPGEALGAHVFGEAGKFLLSCVIFGLSFVYLDELDFLSFIGGYVLTLAAYWVALLKF